MEQRPASGETMRRVGLGAGLAIGMGVGVALGAGAGNMGTGIALGLVVGAAIMVLFTVAGTRMDRAEARRRAEAAQQARLDPDAGEPGADQAGGAASQPSADA